MSLTLTENLLRRYISDIFVETGTHKGLCVDLAIKIGFNEIYSIEVHEPLYLFNKEKFKNNQNIKLFYGNSSELLYKICQDIPKDKKITFWLDGHYMGESNKHNRFPLINELKQIQLLSNKTHTILIDDVRLFGNYLPHTLDEVKEHILNINPNYKILLQDSKYKDNDIMVAYI